jgi:hypothetical protein
LSTDGTRQILEGDPRVSIVTREFVSFADQCNVGLEQIDTEWVLSLDADYICTSELVAEIAALPPSPAQNGFRAAFKYCINGTPLRGSLYPPRTVLYRRDRAHYVSDGHAHRVVVGGETGSLASVILHDDRKPLDSWLRAQQRYAAKEAEKLLSTPPAELGVNDRIRRHGWIAPLAMPLYCLLWKRLILDGRPGFEYTFQRTYAEMLLSLHLSASTAERAVAQNRHGSAPLPATQEGGGASPQRGSMQRPVRGAAAECDY